MFQSRRVSYRKTAPEMFRHFLAAKKRKISLVANVNLF